MVGENECFKCGISGEKVRLFDAISDREKGIVKICEKCSFNEDIPVIRKPTTFQLKESERKSSVYNRLARSVGIDPEEHRKKMSEEAKAREQELKKQEIGLKDLIDKKLKTKYSKPWVEKKPRPELIDNFHWIIMRARKSKHMTQEQLGDAISESSVAIKMAEQGKLPEDDYRLINKLENYLGIRLRTTDAPPLMKKEPVRVLSFKPEAIKELTISDLQRMKQRREQAELEEQIQEIGKEKGVREETEDEFKEKAGEDEEESVEEMERRIKEKLKEEKRK